MIVWLWWKKFERNKYFLGETNDWTKVIVLDPIKAVKLLDNKSLGYDKIYQEV